MSRLYILDTNIASDLVRNPHGPVTRHIAYAGSESVCVSIINAAELRYGYARKGSAKLLANVEAILGSIKVMAFDAPADTKYGGIQAELEAAEKPIGTSDLLIAAHSHALRAVLVTANTGEFGCVRGLDVENWLSQS